MNELNVHDLTWAVRRLPKNVRELLKTTGPTIFLAGGYLRAIVAGAIRAMGGLDLTGQQPERSFTSRLGFGGKVDLHTPACVIDFKTKDGDLADVECYPEHWMQGAAYSHGLGLQAAECANVFVSRTHPGRAKLVRHNHSDTERGWTMFRHLLGYWFTANSYRPSWAIQAIEAA